MGAFQRLDTFLSLSSQLGCELLKRQKLCVSYEEETSGVGKQRRLRCVESLLCARRSILGASTYTHQMFSPNYHEGIHIPILQVGKIRLNKV